MISGNDSIGGQTISADGVAAILAGTPLSAYANTILTLSQKYGIDANWILSYLRWENGFGSANSFSIGNNNPWDILCYPGQWGEVGQDNESNGYCYAVYPSMNVGLEAGYRLWSSYVSEGYNTWFKSLSVAECGNPDGCSGSWVQNVIAQANRNASEYPYVPSMPATGGSGGTQPPMPALAIGNWQPSALAVSLGMLAVVAAGAMAYYAVNGRL